MLETWLEAEQLQDAEAAYSELKRAGRLNLSLADITRKYLAAAKPCPPVRADKAIEAYVHDLAKRGCAKRYCASVEDSLKLCWTSLQREKVHEATALALEGWVFEAGNTANTQITRRAHLGGFYGWLVKRGYAPENLAAGLDRPRLRKPLPEIFSVETCKRLLDAAAIEGNRQHGEPESPGLMLPYIAVCLLSGVRPEEAKRLKGWEAFDIDAHQHIVLDETVTKTRARFVPIHENLSAILHWCKARGLEPGYYSRRLFTRIKEAAGVNFLWNGGYNDVLRHTYASHRYALGKDMAALSHAMGNSPAELKRSYLRPVTAEAATAFDKLMPTGLG